MSDRDRLAADLHSAICDYHFPDLPPCGIDHADDADRLIALGWTNSNDAATHSKPSNAVPTLDEAYREEAG